MIFGPEFPARLIELLPEDIQGVYRLNQYEWTDTIGAFRNRGGIVVIPREDRASKWVEVYPSAGTTAWEITREAFERFGEIPPMSTATLTENETETINRTFDADGNTNQPSGATGMAGIERIGDDGRNPGNFTGTDNSQTGGQDPPGFISAFAQSGIGPMAGGTDLFGNPPQNAPGMGSGGNPSWTSPSGGMGTTNPGTWPSGLFGRTSAGTSGGGLGGNFGLGGGNAPLLEDSEEEPPRTPEEETLEETQGTPEETQETRVEDTREEEDPQEGLHHRMRRSLNLRRRTRTTDPPMIKINPPDVFDGERSDMQNFINQCNSWFTMYETSFQNDVQRVIFILSYISNKGKTGQWKQNYHRVYTNPQTKRFFPPSLAQFDADFQKAFGAIEEVQKARKKILDVTQDRKDIDDYITEFNNLAGKAQYDRYSADGNALLITLFEKGLPEHTTRYIIGFGRYQRPLMNGSPLPRTMKIRTRYS
ncbi:hypothetical protein NW765_016868 [Fusarium oxysporum]|nr:hypothetical protein NW765_016868 [Fusarium oxysporum]